MRRLIPRLTIAALLVLATAGMVLQAGSVPHLHQASAPGIYNEEHDLTLLAGFAAQALLAAVAPIPAPAAAVSSVPPLVSERPVVRLARSGDSRAPPSA